MSETYISILRGINVSGQKKIRMEDLRNLFEELGFSDVITYIQSGNVIFRSAGNSSESLLREKIQKKIRGKYHFAVPVIIRTASDMERILTGNPLLSDSSVKQDKLHVTFLSEKPEPEVAERLHEDDFSPEKFKIVDREVYLYCPNGYGRTKLSNNFFEGKLKVQATTRNWKTVNKLAEISG